LILSCSGVLENQKGGSWSFDKNLLILGAIKEGEDPLSVPLFMYLSRSKFIIYQWDSCPKKWVRE